MPGCDEGVEGLVDYSEDGVDLTLIRWALSLTPDERLSVLQDCVNSIEAIREENASV
jgi:hypothetical protein